MNASPPSSSSPGLDGCPASPFYVTGGTLPLHAESYVPRQADEDLYEALIERRFCYILTSRQVGKSSLMVRTAVRLREAGVGVAVTDLTAFGQNLDPEQWYEGLLARIGQQLDLEDELEDFWDDNESMGPLHRWVEAIRTVVLAERDTPIVIFVDEIDVVRSLGFSTDEFFAAIRECHNRRAAEPEMERLTFCLIGVATPTDLIQDTRLTPFNIGTRIELADLTVEDAAPLARGMGGGGDTGHRLLERVFHWTSGHPYLTQKLCAAVADHEAAATDAHVDRICEDLFLSDRARDMDDNLVYVREGMLRSEVDRAALLDAYGRVYAGKQVRLDDGDRVITVLFLAGVTSGENGELRLRNRIYEHVFDKRWIRENMPDAEIRRQKAAARKAMFRTGAVAAVVVVAMGLLAMVAVRQSRTAREISARAQIERGVQLLESDDSMGLLYLIEARRQAPKGSDMRASAERIWAGWHAIYEDRLIGVMDHEQAHAVTFTADGRLILSGSRHPPVRIYDVVAQAPTGVELHHPQGVWGVAASPDSTLAATAGIDHTARLWNLATGEPYGVPLEHDDIVAAVRFSPDGLRVGTVSMDDTARIWDVASGAPITEPLQHRNNLYDLAFSPDGAHLVTACADGTASIWDVNTGVLVSNAFTHDGQVLGVAFSPDGKYLVTTSDDATAKLWDIATESLVGTPMPHETGLGRVKFNLDGSLILAGSSGNAAQIWNAHTQERVGLPLRHQDSVWAVDFSPDGETAVTASGDGTLRLWNVRAGRWSRRYIPHPSVIDAAFSPDSALVATVGSDGAARLWRPESGEAATAPFVPDSVEPLRSVEFSPDGSLLATASATTLWLWDLRQAAPSASSVHFDTTVQDISFSPRGDYIAASGPNGVYLWKSGVTDPGPSLRSPVGPTRVTFSRDGAVLAAGGDEEVAMWDVDTRRRMLSGATHGGYSYDMAFSPDGALLGVATHNNELRFWGVVSRRRDGAPLRHNATTYRVAFSPDSAVVATAAGPSTVRVWDLDTRVPLAAPFQRVWLANGPTFSPNGRWLLTGATDEEGVYVWNVPSTPGGLEEMERRTQLSLGSRLQERGVVEPVGSQEWRELRAYAADRGDR